VISKNRHQPEGVPSVLVTMAAWSWRLLLLCGMVYLIAWIIGRISIVVLPVAIAFLLTALLYPLTKRLRDAGLRPIYATWITMLLGLAVIVGVGFLIGNRANEEFPRLVEQLQRTAAEAQHWLLNGPLQLKQAQITHIVDEIGKQLTEQRNEIVNTVLTGATAVLEALASFVLVVFVTFFLLKDGDKIWAWFLKAFGDAAPRVDRAGRAAWVTICHYVQGTVAIAAIHGIVMGTVLAVMGVPLWVPLAVLIFLGSFIPIIGIVVTGGLATLVTLGAQGWISALVFLAILVVEQQLENHLFQPQIVGRAIDFHPLAVILVLAVGGVIAGIPGAAVAVPLTAVLYRALPELFRAERPAPPPGVPAAAPAGSPAGPSAGTAPTPAAPATPSPEPGAPAEPAPPREPGGDQGAANREPESGEAVSPQRKG